MRKNTKTIIAAVVELIVETIIDVIVGLALD